MDHLVEDHHALVEVVVRNVVHHVHKIVADLLQIQIMVEVDAALVEHSVEQPQLVVHVPEVVHQHAHIMEQVRHAQGVLPDAKQIVRFNAHQHVVMDVIQAVVTHAKLHVVDNVEVHARHMVAHHMVELVVDHVAQHALQTVIQNVINHAHLIVLKPVEKVVL